MKCCCPECGHVAGMAQFASEADARECMRLAMEMPRPLADALMRYLQLFRPPQRALSWSRALRLMQPLHADITRGCITRRGRDWVAPQAAWQNALQTTVNRRDELTLPLRDHSYLYEIISRDANKGEAQAEQRVEDQRRKRGDRERAAPTSPHDDPSIQRAAPPGGSIRAALSQARAATASPTTQSNEED